MLQIYEKIAEKIAHKRVFLTFLSLILIQTFALAQNDSKITIQQKNITVIDALKTVEKQSKKSINYSDSELKGKVIAQLNLRNASLETALDTILKGTGFSFQIQGNYIIIAEKKPVVAQTLKNIKGKVTDESGEPLIGVNISVDGSSTGTITDFDGNFTIKAAEKSILKVSYIGYAAQIIPVSKKDFYPVVMKQDTEVLDEVVVTALGIKRAEKALSYNVQQVKGDALTTVKDANFVNSLNGKIAGVSINKSASGVGGATRVVMRGAKSIEGDNNALYVVDGIPLFNTNMGNTDRLHSTASSHKRVMVIEVMGHKAGWIALYSGMAGGGDVILLPEIAYDIKNIGNTILERLKKGKPYSIVVVAEGIRTDGRKRAAEYIAQEIEYETGIETRETVLGYIQRGGSPTPFDRNLSTRMGGHATELIAKGEFGRMVALKGDDIASIPLEEVAGKLKLVTEDHDLVIQGRRMGICFG